MKLADLFVKLGLDSKQFNDGLGDAQKKTNLFADGIKKIGGMIAGAFAVSAIVGFAKEIFALANESIRVENELGAAIRANGKDVETTMAAYKAFANEMQNKTTIDDEATLSALRLAETLQSKAPIEATKNAIALSKAIGVDLNTAIKMAVMAQSDMYTMLGRYVPALRTAGTEAERTAEYTKLLASGQQMLSAELDTSAGKIIQNQNAWENVKETWGSVISQSKLLSIVLKKINDDLTISNSSLKWYEKWWYRITFQHAKGAEKARELGEAETAAAMAGIKGQTEFNNLLGEVNVNAEEYNKRAKQQKEDAIKAWEKENEAISKQNDLLQMIDDTKRKSIKSITSKAVNQEDFNQPSRSDLMGSDDVFSMFPLSEEQDLPTGFDTDAYVKMLDDFNAFKADMAASVQDFGVSVVDEFGQAIGAMLATGDFPADFGQNILAIIGSFISQLGKMLIGLGIASEAFRDLLASSFLAGGLPLIAAGAGLVLLGGAIKGFAKAGPSGSSSGSVSAANYSGSNYGSSGTRAENNQVEFVIKGNTLVGVLNNTKRVNKNIG